MDTSPSRQSERVRPSSVSPLRRDTTKSIPKLPGEQQNVVKNKFGSVAPATSTSPSQRTPAAAENATSEIKTITTPTTATATAITTTTSPTAASKVPPTAQTKIPMKRTPTAIMPSKTVSTPRGTHVPPKPATKTASKISLTIKEIGGKKLDPSASKVCVKAPTSYNLKTPLSLGAKSLTARGAAGVGSRRSGSTISCKSARSQKTVTPAAAAAAAAAAADHNNPPILSKITSTAGDHDGHNLSARERVAENNKLKVFENLHKKLQELQTDFMQKFENLKMTSPEKVKNDYKFITMIKNDECKLMIAEDDQMRIPKKLPVASLSDFKESIRKALDDSLHTLLDNMNTQGNSLDVFPNIEETQIKLEKIQSQKLTEIYDIIHDMCSTKEATESDMQIVKMQKEIQEGKKAVLSLEKKISELKKEHSDELSAHGKEIREKTDSEIIRRDIQIAELQKKHKILEKQNEKLKSSVHQSNEESNNEQAEKVRMQEELRACKESMHGMTKKLTHAENQLAHEKKEKAERVENMRKLENELDAARKKIDDLRNKGKVDYVYQMEEMEKEIEKLRAQLDTTEREKKDIENHMEKLRYDALALCDLRNKLTDADDRIRELQLMLEERNSELADKTELPKEVLNELSKLRQSESEKRREVEKLRVELSKAHFNICQLEEQVQRDQQLLEVRSELINSLQTNDNSQRIHLDEMFAQVGEKNNTINELSAELRTKSEEFRNLFTTLSTKQLELSRQEHMIKLLEESNERSQMLRVKQEEKIGRMEEEIAHLKQTVSIYQSNVLGNAGCKSILFAPVTPNEEYNENFYYYTSERRRKRQVDINVKKYET